MKKLVLKLLTYISNKSLAGIKKLSQQPASPLLSGIPGTAFNSLSPVGDADPQGEYAKALSWALKNRKASDIKNIALTGPYGSGKSSILKTFQAHNQDNDLSFLNISLATFKEETENENSPKGADLLRLIELSILQQIFYHEEDHKIPDSRFKKIKSFKKQQLWLMSLGLFLLILTTVHLIDKTFFWKLTDIKPNDVAKVIINLFSLLVSAVGYFYILFKSIRTISSITINKLNIKDAEIAISDNISKSILNNHIDEILYFFEVTKYTVVVIEDLDRFEQTEIFTKLRELNLLINYSDKIKRDIVFIYAVRDDMFKDKDRTKFFDFIIPVIPVINSSNSNEKLLQIVNKNNYGIKLELIENISLFIDDMRLLYNITNEYYIYHKKLGNLNRDKLLSMIVYKNIYPNDFVDLSNGDGQLYEVFQKKDEFIKEKLGLLDLETAGLKEELKKLDALLIIDRNELRMIYVYKYIEKLPDITSFIINGSVQAFSEVTSDELFPYFISNNLSYHYIRLNYGNQYIREQRGVSLKFAAIEKEVNPKQTYQNRMDLLEDWNRDRQEEIKGKIAALENDKSKIRHFKAHEIIAMGGCKMDLENKKQLQLVNILLRNGYIGEDYLDYISIFYEGSITKEDREFLLNVKAQITSEVDYKLNKLDKLIPKIDPVDFKQPYILNYDLLDFLLGKSTYKQQRSFILDVLKDESAPSVAFIDGFIDNTKHLETFIKQLVKVWPNVWHFISQQSAYPKERTSLYLNLILAHAELTDIKAVAQKSKLAEEISSMPDFLSIDIDKEKVKKIIKELDIKFVNQSLMDVTQELAQFVYENNHYMLNEQMLRTVLTKFGIYEELAFDQKNFNTIRHSNCAKLISYVDLEINTYIRNVYLSLPNNLREVEDSLTALLNMEALAFDNKKAVIDKVETKISVLKNIELVEVAEYLLESAKLIPSWQNLIYFYKWMENKMEPPIIAFINQLPNAQALSFTMIDKDNPVPDLPTVQKFIRELILENKIENNCYALILKSCPYYYDNLSFQELPKEKVEMLIENKKLGMSIANYDLLRTEFNGLHIKLAEVRRISFFSKISDFTVEEPEVFGLLDSTRFIVSEKNTLIAHVGDDLLMESHRISHLLGLFATLSDELNISKEVILHILKNALSDEERLQLLVKKFALLTKDEVFDILSTLPEPYSDIAVLGKRPSLNTNDLNASLAHQLVMAGFIKRATAVDGKIRISTFRQ